MNAHAFGGGEAASVGSFSGDHGWTDLRFTEGQKADLDSRFEL
jgi:hypothetical protein